MNDEVTYYCGEHVFLSFLKSKELWLTSLSQSNDSAEGRWMREYWLNHFAPGHSTAENLARRGAALCMDSASHDRMALGVCFSEERDLLSQWRGYADDGAGFSITFSRRVLKTVVKDHFAGRLQLVKIAYGDQDFDEIRAIEQGLHDAFGEHAKLYSESNGTGSISTSDPEGNMLAKHEEAARSLYTAKNGAFREEKEWRLFTYGSLSSIGGVKLRGTGKAISPYVSVPIPPEAVLSVTLGPNNQTPRHVLDFALTSNGLSDARIETSTASYQSR